MSGMDELDAVRARANLISQALMVLEVAPSAETCSALILLAAGHAVHLRRPPLPLEDFLKLAAALYGIAHKSEAIRIDDKEPPS